MYRVIFCSEIGRREGKEMGNAREEERERRMKEKLGKGNKDTCGGRSVGSTVIKVMSGRS